MSAGAELDSDRSTTRILLFSPYILFYYLFRSLDHSGPSSIIGLASDMQTQSGVFYSDCALGEPSERAQDSTHFSLSFFLSLFLLIMRTLDHGANAIAGLAYDRSIQRTRAEPIEQRTASFSLLIFLFIYYLFRSLDHGASAIVDLASDTQTQSGGFYSDRALSEPSERAHNAQEQTQMWELSERLTGLVEAQ